MDEMQFSDPDDQEEFTRAAAEEAKVDAGESIRAAIRDAQEQANIDQQRLNDQLLFALPSVMADSFVLAGSGMHAKIVFTEKGAPHLPQHARASVLIPIGMIKDMGVIFTQWSENLEKAQRDSAAAELAAAADQARN